MKQKNLRRERVQAAFDAIAQFPLTVVVASMGYGKTTALRAYTEQAEEQIIWISIDSPEATTQYVWNQLVRALDKEDEGLAKKLEQLGFPEIPSQREMILHIIESHSFSQGWILVIDDYHYIQSSAMDLLVERIARAQIPHFHLVIMTRMTPNLPIEELVLKGILYRIDGEIFEMDKEEIRGFFSLHDVTIGSEDLEKISDLSEGWISAVYLMMRRFLQTNQVTTHESLEKLIERGIMDQYGEEDLGLLLALSLFDTIPSAMVSGLFQSFPPGHLHHMTQDNSFIRYDASGDQFVFHRIFRSFLSSNRKALFSENEEHRILESAGTWHARTGDLLKAIDLWMRASAYDRVLDAIISRDVNKIIDNNTLAFHGIFERIPKELLYRRPLAYLAYLGFYVTNINRDIGLERLDDYKKWLITDRQTLEPELFGEIQLIRAYCAFNKTKQMKELMRAAHSCFTNRSRIANRDKIITFGSPHALYLYHRTPGKLVETHDDLIEMFHDYTWMAHGCGRGFDDLIRAEYALETGTFVRAEQEAKKALIGARSLEQISVVIAAQLTLARAANIRGDDRKARLLIEEIKDEVYGYHSAILNSAYDLARGYIAAITDQLSMCPKWLVEGLLDESEVLHEGMGFNEIIRGHVLLCQKRTLALEVFLKELPRAFEANKNLLGFLHGHLLAAAVYGQIGQMDMAVDQLKKALSIGEADQIILPFLEIANHLIPVIERVDSFSEKNPYFKNVLTGIQKIHKSSKTKGLKVNSDTHLSKRENDVLGQLLTGKTNGAIARELHLAEVTVRKYLTSIYRKLGVRGRTEAVRKAYELGLNEQ